jgi:hypothetical protein
MCVLFFFAHSDLAADQIGAPGVVTQDVGTQSVGSQSSAAADQMQLIRVTGAARPSGLRLTLEIGSEAFQALDIESLRVVSEPSGTLLASVARYGATVKGNGERAASVVVPSFTEALPIVLATGPRAAEDERIVVYMVGTWPDGTTEERAIAGGKVGYSAFDFVAYVDDGFMVGKIGTLRQCCYSYECADEVCATCSPFRFSCCTCGEPDCCFAECTLNANCDCVPCWNGCFLIPHSCY